MQEYCLCDAESAYALNKQVNQYLSEGWQVGGSFYVYAVASGDARYCQSVVRTKPDAVPTTEKPTPKDNNTAKAT
ncbi:DUF1737 domain-containing protein [Formicincola oecophyllae]|uniref:DUF1737 domain-containing protein n=1 Tax=Formicincola oecophyllae TaxID=2558361 RepID=A0A4Y6UB07_9PROT|nr:DUF1737 domain-containing protein [Formicincola oecophyllae]QDH13646.1 DUF1737 domain-containing protein [Formicincola oecophyllae]